MRRLIYMVIPIILVLVGCTSRPLGVDPEPAPGPGSDLIAMGRTFIWIGGIAFVVGVAVRIALAIGAVNPATALISRIPGISWLAGNIAEAGAVAVASGICFIWLGNNLWVLIAALVLAALAWAYYRRGTIQRWLLAWKTPK